MLSDSPLNYLDDAVDKTSITSIENLKIGTNQSIVGIVRSIKTIVVKNGKDKGKPMAFISVYDDTDEIDCTFFSSLYSLYQTSIKFNDILVLSGKKEIRENRASFIVRACKIVRS